MNGWFTLYFIPIIPLGTRGFYIECAQCAGTFGPEVLSAMDEVVSADSFNSQSAIATEPDYGSGQFDQIKRLFVLAAVTGGEPKPIQAVQYCYRKVASIELNEFEL